MNQLSYIILLLLLISCSEATENSAQDESLTTLQVLEPKYNNNLSQSLDSIEYNNFITDVSTYVLRKPDAATWYTKFNPEFREYYIEKSKDIEWTADWQLEDTLFGFLIRDGRSYNGNSNRGVGVKLIMHNSKINFFQEVFVTKVTDRLSIERFGQRFLESIEREEPLEKFIQDNRGIIEWPDDKLFYSLEKNEWRYID